MLRSEVAKASSGGGNGGGNDGGNGTSTEILLSELGELLTETTTGAAERKFMDFVWYPRLDLARALIYDRFEKRDLATFSDEAFPKRKRLCLVVRSKWFGHRNGLLEIYPANRACSIRYTTFNGFTRNRNCGRLMHHIAMRNNVSYRFALWLYAFNNNDN
ncbi:hypothetical protein V1478_014295, partial [Vespula squamosa]